MTNNEVIEQAIGYIGNVEPEMFPVSDALRNIGHPYWNDFCFVFCVACDIGRKSRMDNNAPAPESKPRGTAARVARCQVSK